MVGIAFGRSYMGEKLGWKVEELPNAPHGTSANRNDKDFCPKCVLMEKQMEQME